MRGRCCVHDDQFIVCVSVTGEGKNGQANYIISVKIKAPVGMWCPSNMCTVKIMLSCKKFKTNISGSLFYPLCNTVKYWECWTLVLLFIFKTFNKLTFCAVENTGFSRQFASLHALPRAHRNDSLQCAIMCKYPWQRMWCSLNSFNEVPGTFWLKQQMRPWNPNTFRQLWNQLKGTEWCHHIIILSNAIQPIPNRFYFHLQEMCQQNLNGWHNVEEHVISKMNYNKY